MTNPGGRRLKQWLMEQIHSEQYSGLLWEDESRTMFRIPWKHAGKQDYNQEIDASIFKAWAVFKGKFKEGDKAEPATWKTRLRCALNKSPDFEEVTERSQLDISEPYKVYRIVPEEEQKNGKSSVMITAAATSCGDVTDMDCSPADIEGLIKEEDSCNIQASPEYWPQSSGNAFSLHQDPLPSGPHSSAFSQMMISFYYGGKLMNNTLVTHPEGCRISPGQHQMCRGALYSSDGMQSVHFPPADLIEYERQRHITHKLLGHLERGVLLRSNHEGLLIKRLCQSRVFWSGLGEQYSPVPCKLERDAVVKIFDTGRFLQALQLYQEGQFPTPPDPTVTLCFGEELQDLSSAKTKLIIVHITVVNCQHLLEAVNQRRPQLYCNNPVLDMTDDMATEQMARIYQDLCSYSSPQRPACYRDNMPITA
ncbi:interferon regulatory factor 8 [Aulostomus maculatus]